jgi:hypothetical protein
MRGLVEALTIIVGRQDTVSFPIVALLGFDPSSLGLARDPIRRFGTGHVLEAPTGTVDSDDHALADPDFNDCQFRRIF